MNAKTSLEAVAPKRRFLFQDHPLNFACITCGAVDGMRCRDTARGWKPYPVSFIYHRARIEAARPELREPNQEHEL